MIDKTIVSQTETKPFNDATFPCPVCEGQGKQEKVHRTVKDHYGTLYIHIAIQCICTSATHVDRPSHAHHWYHHLSPMLCKVSEE